MTSSPQEFSAQALQEWTHHVESVLRGIAHALNNRAAALSAVIELSSDPDDDPAETRQILESEMARLQELVQVVRNVGAPRGDAEAFVPSELAPEIGSVLGLHMDLRDRAIVVDGNAAPPIRTPRWKFMRAVIALGAASPASNRSLRVRLDHEGDWCTIRVEPAGASLYATEMARALGGEPLPDGSGIRVPTLEAVRRREAR